MSLKLERGTSMELYVPKDINKFIARKDQWLKCFELLDSTQAHSIFSRPFISLTRGTSGDTRNTEERHLEMLELLQSWLDEDGFDIDLISHFTLSHYSQGAIERTLDAGAKGFAVLTGDVEPSQDAIDAGFRYSSDLLKHIVENCQHKACNGKVLRMFSSVYPSGHFQDTHFLERYGCSVNKLEIRDDVKLISQFFISPNTYLDFLRNFDTILRLNGDRSIDMSQRIVAGYLPKISTGHILKMVDLCGYRMSDDDQDYMRLLESRPSDYGMSILLDGEMIALREQPLHIYSMNDPEITQTVLESRINAIKF